MVLFVPTVGVEPDVGEDVGCFVSVDGRLLEDGRELLEGLNVGNVLLVGDKVGWFVAT